jgi:hypothetical protein
LNAVHGHRRGLGWERDHYPTPPVSRILRRC